MKILIPIVTLAILAAGLVYAYPISALTALFQAQLQLKQVHSETYRDVHVYRKNYCSHPEECQCVLLIHGLGDEGLTWKRVLMGEGLTSPPPSVHLFAVDLPGSGDTPALKDSHDYRISHLARVVKDSVMDQCESWVVVGNSFGGWIAAEIALSYPTLLSGLMLENAAGLDRDYSDILPAFVDPSPESLREFRAKAYYNSFPVPDFIAQSAIRKFEKMPIIQMLKSQQGGTEFLDHRIKQIRMPTALLWGDSDRIIPLDHGIEFANAIPQASLRVAKNCGHLPHKECPQDFWTSFQRLLDQVQ
ncbi:MAG: alpha/beta hydrolase [Pseudobdellovibrionaceae bacterium]|nr:alpha/beta hydrolase [Bdellovibrionales bacterium]USN47588.1 MAG: alpha/beta hydrolase [Pseudobdellovibrionaceae bacterium]